jgi:hypothetical protein
VAPPVLSGATPKTVRARKGAKRVRVTYRVTANDAIDGHVPVGCVPRSGSRFPIGRVEQRVGRLGDPGADQRVEPLEGGISLGHVR